MKGNAINHFVRRWGLGWWGEVSPGASLLHLTSHRLLCPEGGRATCTNLLFEISLHRVSGMFSKESGTELS